MIRRLALIATCCTALAAFSACGGDAEPPGSSPAFDTGSGGFDAGSGGGFDTGSGGGFDAGAEPCTPGDTRPADDGCNTCFCDDDGSWACTEMGCVGECVTDDDCVVSGCSGQLCGAEPMDSDCAWYDEYACYQDEAITTCGCNDGVCGWAETDALDACLGG